MADTKTTIVKIKPNPQNAPSKPRVTDSSSKMKSVTTNTVIKTEVKSKPTTMSSSSSKTTISKTETKTTTTKVRARKVYSLPGQKHDPPEEKEPLRIFYESLSKQIPTSEMAEFWLMEHGLLSPQKAKKAFEKKQRKQKEIRTGTPVKSSSKPPIKTETSQKQQPRPNNAGTSQKPQQRSNNGDIKAKRKIDTDSDDDDDDDFILSHKRRKG
ncbi:hypothetical protein L195_g006049 [Trifolium pratense]|uniref:Uncharacterized protein n=2 Tax=Trifolium pratense TaxID=57577 RepID=A0A2K3P2H5_TRIPR|nr:uncharacterized protein LOC123893701 [Trifolium pratense]PNY09496.1 hypothetical protein L195_g006049 [Trifolium pratense]CAJ2643246.1 unnamed protein product [Trifolium pratense]